MVDSIFYHDNVAPNMAKHLIQRFTTSNPYAGFRLACKHQSATSSDHAFNLDCCADTCRSPRYVQAVGDAFKTGEYDGTTYSGKYGDLAAMIVALLSDREARSITLDALPTAGMLREPILKTVHLLRALEYQANNGIEIRTNVLELKIGQQVHRSPSVFNFYKPDHEPSGPIAEAGLVSPEAELLTAPLMVGFLNAAHSLIKSGLTSCDEGFGVEKRYVPRVCTTSSYDGTAEQLGHEDSFAVSGKLTLPATKDTAVELVDDLDLLLTAGRLNEYNKDTITQRVASMMSGTELAYMVVDGQGTPELSPDTSLDNDHIHEYCAPAHELHEVVCCSDTPSGHGERNYNNARNKANCAAEGTTPLRIQSLILDRNGGPATAACVHENSYEEAAAVCAADNAHLCTRDEIAHGCASAVTCGHKHDFLWTGTPCNISSTAAIKFAQSLIVSTGEFHTTADNTMQGLDPRPPGPQVESLGRPYKAVVLLYFAGGLDSWNMIVPHSECEVAGRDMYAEYEAVRGGFEVGEDVEVEDTVAIEKHRLLPINVAAGTQPCNVFGVHPSLTLVKQLYEDGDASFVANIGSLVEPIPSIDEFRAKSVAIPPSIGSHSTQTKQAQSVHADHAGAKGVLGRMKAQGYSIYGNEKATQGKVAPIQIDMNTGLKRLQQFGSYGPSIMNLTVPESQSVFADTFAAGLAAALVTANELGAILEDAPDLTQSYDESKLGRQLRNVAELISVRATTQSERDVFIVVDPSYDTHQDMTAKVTTKLAGVNNCLESFVNEMKHMGIWDGITIVSSSEFGRTLSSNGLGTSPCLSLEPAGA
jgi:cullin-associated NEDD8-dissociated protein 1